jgi:hypothetical protein
MPAADLRLRFDVLKYVTDRRDGKPVQFVSADVEHRGQTEAEITARLIAGRQRVRVDDGEK